MILIELPTHDENLLVSLAMTTSIVSACYEPVGVVAALAAWEKGICSLCKATTLKMNPRERTNTTTGSTLSPGDSSVYNPAENIAC